MKKFIRYYLIVLLIGMSAGCSTVTVRTNAAQAADDPSLPNEGTVHRLFWGYFPLGGDYIVRDCSSKSLQSVNVHANWWEFIVTVVTGGIYCPVEVSYLCAKEASPELTGNPVSIEPVYSGTDTLVTLYIGYLKQDKVYWNWHAWLTNTKQQTRTSFTILAAKDTLNYLLSGFKNQVNYTVGFINESDPDLHLKLKSR